MGCDPRSRRTPKQRPLKFYTVFSDVLFQVLAEGARLAHYAGRSRCVIERDQLKPFYFA